MIDREVPAAEFRLRTARPRIFRVGFGHAVGVRHHAEIPAELPVSAELRNSERPVPVEHCFAGLERLERGVRIPPGRLGREDVARNPVDGVFAVAPAHEGQQLA